MLLFRGELVINTLDNTDAIERYQLAWFGAKSIDPHPLRYHPEFKEYVLISLQGCECWLNTCDGILHSLILKRVFVEMVYLMSVKWFLCPSLILPLKTSELIWRVRCSLAIASLSIFNQYFYLSDNLRFCRTMHTMCCVVLLPHSQNGAGRLGCW